jgi:hypothetical protein
MATITNPNFIQIVGYPENLAFVNKATQNDVLLFPQDPMILIENAYLDEYGAESFVMNSLTVASVASTDTTLTYSAGSGVPRLKGSYFLKIGSEYVHVKSDTDETAATGTLTVIRGVLGTTIADHAGGSAYIQNSIKLTSVNVGQVKILYKGVPLFPSGLNLSTESKRVWSDINPNRVYGSEYTTPV